MSQWVDVIHVTARFSQVHFPVKEFHYAGKGVLKFDLEMNLKLSLVCVGGAASQLSRRMPVSRVAIAC